MRPKRYVVTSFFKGPKGSAWQTIKPVILKRPQEMVPTWGKVLLCVVSKVDPEFMTQEEIPELHSLLVEYAPSLARLDLEKAQWGAAVTKSARALARGFALR